MLAFNGLCPVAVFLQDVRDDVGGAQNTGMLGILVKTGKRKKSKLFLLFILNFFHCHVFIVTNN